MSEEDPFFIERKLKKFSTSDIESEISKAISKLSGVDYDVEITKFNFNPKSSNYMSDRYEIKLCVDRAVKSEDLPF